MPLRVHPAFYLLGRGSLSTDVLSATVITYIGSVRADVAVQGSGFLCPDFGQLHQALIHGERVKTTILPLQVSKANGFLGFFPKASSGI